jgi:excisionase family DNA binding protein
MGDSLTVSQAAAQIGYSARTVRRWISERLLPAHRGADRGHWRIYQHDLDARMRELENDG